MEREGLAQEHFDMLVDNIIREIYSTLSETIDRLRELGATRPEVLDCLHQAVNKAVENARVSPATCMVPIDLIPASWRKQ
jgi:hypothetical protein